MGLIDWLFGRPGGRGVEDLARRLKIPLETLRAVEIVYHRFEIPKRSKGVRVILAPSRELKEIQRRILRRLLWGLKTHPAATGFEPGESIVTNANRHVGRAVVVRMDLKDFFPSTTAKQVERYLRKVGWKPDAAKLLTKLCTHDGCLPQGAPTSPRLSNLLNVHLDTRLERLAEKIGATYTRYADDLTFSLAEDDPAKVRALVHFAGLIVEEEGYDPHRREKLYVRRRCDRQVVTGLVVNERVALPRQTRRWLRSVEHRLATGRPATISEDQIAGWRALAAMVEKQAGRGGGRKDEERNPNDESMTKLE